MRKQLDHVFGIVWAAIRTLDLLDSVISRLNNLLPLHHLQLLNHVLVLQERLSHKRLKLPRLLLKRVKARFIVHFELGLQSNTMA